MSIPVLPVPTFKLIVAGSRYVGKTTFLKRLRTGEFNKVYHPSQGVDVHPINFNTNYGTYCFNAWDIPSDVSNYDSVYYQGGTCAIIMFATSIISSVNDVVGYYNAIKLECGDIPIVLIQHKNDHSHIYLSPEQQLKILNTVGLEGYYGVSSLGDYNLESPFIHLLRQLAKKTDLNLIRTPTIQPPSFTLNPKIEPKVETKVEPKVEPKVETKVKPKVESKTLKNQVRNYLYESVEKRTIIVENIPLIESDNIELCVILTGMLRKRFEVCGEENLFIFPVNRSVCIIEYNSEERALKAVTDQNGERFDLYHVLLVSQLNSANKTSINCFYLSNPNY